jgi:GDPmannose 4,6-dehydratase
MKVALITGITGQDGSYLAEFLLQKGYEVHGVLRRNSGSSYSPHIKKLEDSSNVYFHYGDFADHSTINNILSDVMPDEIYNLASQSHVKLSYSNLLYTSNVNSLGACSLIESIRSHNLFKSVRLYQAGSSEMYGNSSVSPQNESTSFSPVSPYGISKLHAHLVVKSYREMYGMFGCNGILFNHESPRRGDDFVTRKITKTLSQIKKGKRKNPLELGNLDAKRDWGHAKDYVEAMWLILQQDQPNDYVISSGKQHSVRDFIDLACKHIGFDLEWSGSGIDEVAVLKDTERVLVKINQSHYRPIEINNLVGDPSFAKRTLNWNPKYSFEDLVKEMCDYDMGEVE